MRQISAYLMADEEQAAPLLQALADVPLDQLEPALQQVLTGPALWRRESIETGMLPDRLIEVDGEARRYGLYVPPTYRPDRAYPLVLCLHGAGFQGDAYLERWQPRLGDDYILACPSVPAGAWWTRESEALALAVLDQVTRLYHVDRDRVFLTGMSNGGLGTYFIGLNHIDRFAALVPMAGAFPRVFYPLFENARQTPFYIIHGARDQVIPVFFSRNAVSYLKQEGHDVLYREFDKVHPVAGGHFFPRDELPALMVWLADRRRARPDEVTIVRDRDHLQRTAWLRIDEPSTDVGSFWASQQDKEEGRRLEEGGFARLEARVEGNTIWVNAKHVRRYSLLLPRGLVVLSQPVRVITNGIVSYDDTPPLAGRLLLEEARRLPDPGRLVMAAIEVDLP